MSNLENNIEKWQLHFSFPQKHLHLIEDSLNKEDEPPLVFSYFEDKGNPHNYHYRFIFEKKPDSQKFEKILKMINPDASFNLSITKIEDRDWLKENYESFQPFEVGSFFIHGSHIDLKKDIQCPPNKIPIQIDAATAFGSGEHETTKLCLQLFEWALTENIIPQKNLTLADIGCGSAILTIAAAKKIGNNIAQPILGIDIDEEAIHVSKANAVSNQVSKLTEFICCDGHDFQKLQKEKIPTGCDLIFANILANPLIEMSENLIAALKIGGVLILSGILTTQAPKIEKSYSAKGLHLTKKITLGDWAGLLMTKI